MDRGIRQTSQKDRIWKITRDSHIKWINALSDRQILCASSSICFLGFVQMHTNLHQYSRKEKEQEKQSLGYVGAH